MSCENHVSYQDCISGKIGAPADPKQKSVFQIMMITCMVTVMVTFNWLVRTSSISLESFAESLYLYPLTFIVVLCVRFLIANPLLGQVSRKLINPNFERTQRALLNTFINVVFMGTVTAVLILPVTNGGLAIITPSFLLMNLVISYCASFIINYFIVGPAIKKLFEERVREHIPTVRKNRAINRWI